ncbi:MAG: glucosaminidase domain-containing protein [Verrucomicrobiota bacterium]
MNIRWLIALMALAAMILCACGEKERVLKSEVIVLENTDQIVPLGDSLAKPLLYRNIPALNSHHIDETKNRFIAIILPAILIAKYQLAQDQKNIRALFGKVNWEVEDSTFYLHQKERFKANDLEDLVGRMMTHPNSIILAQAAVESGWGSSRFFREGNNLFGIWAYREDEPRIPANEDNVHLRKYSDISESIEDYFETLGRARPYREFRKARTAYNNIYDLLPHLKYYSERGKDYTDQLAAIIRQNNLTQYDNYQIDPSYFFEE